MEEEGGKGERVHNSLEINYIYQYLTFYMYMALDSTSFLNCSKNKFIPPSCLELYFTIHNYVTN